MEEKIKPKLSRYTDPTGEFTNRELKTAEWYLKHKLLLQNIVKWFLILLCVITIGYSFSYWIYYFAYGYFKDQQMYARQTQELQNYTNIQPMYSAQDLQVGNVDAYNSVSSLYDFSARVVNPNERWIATVHYKFAFAGGETPIKKTVIWPKSERPVMYFGYESGSYPNYLRFVIEKVEWQRINPHSSLNIPNFIAERSKISVENLIFTPSSRSAGILNNMISFSLFNDTAYNFWDPEFYVELKDGAQTVGYIYLALEKFKAGEERRVDLRSWVDNLNVSDIVLWPAFNIFDKTEYMPVGE